MALDFHSVYLHPFAVSWADRAMHCLVDGTLLALFAGLLLHLIPRQNSGTRFAVWFCVLIGIALLPFSGIYRLFSSAGGAGAQTAAIILPRSWALPIFLLWAGVAFAGLARIVLALIQIRRLRQDCSPFDVRCLEPRLCELLRQFLSERRVKLYVSQWTQVPMAIGFWRPAVLLPAWLLDEITPEELHQVLLHELAHLRRWDDWTNLAQKTLRAILFFHPAVWWIEARLSLEREMACDDLVLEQTRDRRAYAECLALLAEKSFLRRGLALAQAAVDRIRQTTMRVARILDSSRPSATRIYRPAVMAVAALIAGCGIWLGRAPRLVAFDGPAPPITAQSLANSSTASALLAENPSKPPRIVRTMARPSRSRQPQNGRAAAASIKASPSTTRPLVGDRPSTAPGAGAENGIESASTDAPDAPDAAGFAAFAETTAAIRAELAAFAELQYEMNRPRPLPAPLLLLSPDGCLHSPPALVIVVTAKDGRAAVWQMTVWHLVLRPAGDSTGLQRLI